MYKRSHSYKSVPWILTLFIFLTLAALYSQQPQEEPKKQETQESPTIKEYVEVINVEMIVRALHKGQPVGGLKKSDFVLMEDGKELEITSFIEVRRKIGKKAAVTDSKDSSADMQGQAVKPPKKRFFLLYFWLAERDIKYIESLNYFFDKVYKEGDTALLVNKNKAFQIRNRGEIAAAVKKLEHEINISSDHLKQWMKTTARKLQRTFDRYTEALERVDINEMGEEMLDTHRNVIKYTFDSSWQEYRYRYLTSDTNRLMALADALKDLKMEKWGLVFYQHNIFPTYNKNRMNLIMARADWKEKSKMVKMLDPIDLRIKRPPASLFHIKRVQQAFIRANATFHLLLPEMRTKFDVTARSLVLNDVYSDWKEAFRQISQATGGEVIGGNHLKKSMQKVVEREDIYYRLTYEPRNVQNEKRNIAIKTKKKGFKIFHVSRVKVASPDSGW